MSQVCQPRGNILTEFLVRGGCQAFGAPAFPQRPRLAFAGVAQTFERGEIAHYPRFPRGAATPDFVLSAYLSGGRTWVNWGSTAPFSYDEFILRWDLEDHPDRIAEQHENDEDPAKTQQLSVEQGGSSGQASFTDADEGTYRIYVEGCDGDCDEGWSYPVFVENLPREPGKAPADPTPPTIYKPGGIAVDFPDLLKLSPEAEAQSLGRLCGRALIEGDGEHAGEINADIAVVRMRVAEILDSPAPAPALLGGKLGGDCAGKQPEEIRDTVRDAVMAATVVSESGTGVDWIVRAAASAATGLIVSVLILTPIAVVTPLLSPLAYVLGVSVGTLLGLLLLEGKPGDYDMRMVNTLRLYHLYGDEIGADARNRIVDTLLIEEGGSDEVDTVKYIGPVPVPETENHVLMTQTARYLKNNILFDRSGDPEYDNDANGMTDWVLTRLRELLVEGFYETNSRPYALLSFSALQNLADFAAVGTPGGRCWQLPPPGVPTSRRCDVKRSARSLLDIEAAKFAAVSEGSRRAPPFRRQPIYRDYPRLLTTAGDDMAWRLYPYTGGTGFLRDERRGLLMEHVDGMFVSASLSRWRPPAMITGLLREPGNPGGLEVQRFRSTARGTNFPEVVYRGKGYLIAGGGRYDSGTGFFPSLFSQGEDGWAFPTNLVPALQGEDIRDFVRIEGSRKHDLRSNICVGPGFACGMNPALPAGLPYDCAEKVGNWTFLDFARDDTICPFGFGYYVAFWRQDCETDICTDFAIGPVDLGIERGSFGFFAVQPARNFPTFMSEVLSLNKDMDFAFDQLNIYKSPDGTVISFYVNPGSDWEIATVSGMAGPRPIERDLEKWPVAVGPVIDSPQEACVVIENQGMRQRLIIDQIDRFKPKRALVNLPSRCGCPVQDICVGPRSE